MDERGQLSWTLPKIETNTESIKSMQRVSCSYLWIEPYMRAIFVTIVEHLNNMDI